MAHYHFQPKPLAWVKRGECMICTSHHLRKYSKLGKLVMRHTCDERTCINPAHLLIGTRMDNINDMIARGRAWWLQTGEMT